MMFDSLTKFLLSTAAVFATLSLFQVLLLTCVEGGTSWVQQKVFSFRGNNMWDQDSPLTFAQPETSSKTERNNANIMEPPLVQAARENQVERVKQLLEQDAKVGAKDGNEAALIAATVYGHVEVAKLLLDYGAQVDAKDTYGRTAFMLSVYLKRIPMSKLLLKAGADINAVDHRGNTALSYSVFDEAVVFVDALCAMGQTKAAKNKALTAANQMGRMNAARVLLNNGADANCILSRC